MKLFLSLTVACLNLCLVRGYQKQFKVLAARDGFLTFCCVGVGCDNICDKYNVLWGPIPGYNLADIVGAAEEHPWPGQPGITPPPPTRRLGDEGIMADAAVTDGVALPASRRLDNEIPTDMQFLQWWYSLERGERTDIVRAIIESLACTILVIVLEFIRNVYPEEYAAFLVEDDYTQDDIDKLAMYCFAKAGAVCALVGGIDCCRSGMCFDDPHFKTWTGLPYDFHGECDLKFVSSPQFGEGLGLDIDIRTTARYDYSFIESVAIKIADDTFEVSGFGEYMINGISNAEFPFALSVFAVSHEQINEHEHEFNIDLGHYQTLVVKTFKDWVSVKVDNAWPLDWAKSYGMLGNFATGQMLARNGTTMMEDHDAFGQEWQIQENEPNLFQVSRLPQYPKQACILPEEKATGRRLLKDSPVSMKAAEKACVMVGSANKDTCVYDVLASGDLKRASAAAF